MNTFRQIPLHMLLLAGLLGTAEAKDKEQPASSAAKPAAAGVAARGIARAAQRLSLRMGATAGLGPAAPDHTAFLHQHAAHGRVGPGIAQAAPRQGQCRAHMGQILVHRRIIGAGTNRALFLPAQFTKKSLEILRLAKIAIDAGKAHIGHLVQFLQRFHHNLPNLVGGDVAFAFGFQPALDGID